MPCAGLMDGLGCIALGGEGDSKARATAATLREVEFLGGAQVVADGAGRQFVVIATKRSSHGDER